MVNNGTAELSERELEILRLVATGASNKEIAQKLFISSNTVRVHLRNIFNKIGVASRTEAAMHAVRIGLVQTSIVKVATEDEPATPDQAEPTLSSSSNLLSKLRTLLQRWGVGLIIIMVLAAIVLGVIIAQLPIFQADAKETPVVGVQPSPTAIDRWQEHAALPTARGALALAAFEGNIYAIGGETVDAVIGTVERYNPQTDSWTTLSPKPLAVADINAAVLGGKIYVPGGRVNSGEITNTLQSYDPLKNTWETYSPLPSAISAYAMITFEGRIYLFGGWDGQSYVNSVYVYDPNLDTWEVKTPMPTARGLCGAAVSSGQIYILGGTNGNTSLTTTEMYIPSRDDGFNNPWQTGPALPNGRYAMGTASASDMIYIIGGKSDDAQDLAILELSPTAPIWQSISASIPATWSSLGIVSLGPHLYLMGGLVENNPTGLNLSYQAIYTVVIPIVR